MQRRTYLKINNSLECVALFKKFYIYPYITLRALCRHFNVTPATGVPREVGEMFDMLVLHDAHMPTHVLSARQSDQPDSAPTMLPINSILFEQGFYLNLEIPPAPPGSTAPVPRIDDRTQRLVVSLPVVHITAPHVESLPLLLLYAMKLENDLLLLAHNLLPVHVVGEFPGLPAMLTFLRILGDYDFDRIFRFNQGMRNNSLTLVPVSEELNTVISNAWNAAAEARRAHQRGGRQ
jgi:hypothetical protein